MPVADFGKDLNLPKSDGRYAKLSKKGDKIKFRIANTPHYETKHFLPDRSIVLCEKYNADDPSLTCKYCDDYQKAVDIGDEAMQRQMKPVTNFYYPIVDLDLNKARIFQFSAKGIHYGIKGYADEGVDVFDCNWLVERTEDKKTGYYKLLRLDSKPLTKEQEEQLEIAKTFTFTQKASESVSTEEEITEEDLENVDAENV